MLLSGVLLSLLARDFGFTVAKRHDLDLLVETQQGLRAAISEVTQELRQAGACMPDTGDFMALDGEDRGTQDSLTVRIGRVSPADVVCIRTILTENAAAGASVLQVEDSSRFAADDLLYLVGSTGTGSTLKVSGVGLGTMSLAGRLDADYKTGDGVFGIEERTYEVDASSGRPVLTVAVDGGEPQPLVDGVERFDVRYRLSPCPPCDPVDEPANDAEWYSVREVTVDVGIVSHAAQRGGDLVRLSGTTNVRPRNLF
jgi:hypothetical protein